MAIRDGKFLRGALGPLIYRVVRGKQRVSIKPEPGTTKQTKKTKVAGRRFGMASSLGAEIRKTFEVNLGTAFDPTAGERLISALVEILGECQDRKTKRYTFNQDSFAKLVGFDFNIYCMMKRLQAMSTDVSIKDGVMRIKIYDFQVAEQFSFSPGSFKCQLTVSMSLLRLRDGLMLGKAEKKTMEFSKDMDIVEVQNFDFKVPAGCLCLAKMSLKFLIAGKTGWQEVVRKTMNPSCIIGAFITPGLYEQDSRKRWIQIVKFE